MKTLPLLALLVIAAAVSAQCPLGRTPETGCPESEPACALYVDADGDGLCDNPGPQPAAEDSAVVEDAAPDSAHTADPPPPDDEQPADPHPEEEPDDRGSTHTGRGNGSPPQPHRLFVGLPRPPEAVFAGSPNTCPLNLTAAAACPDSQPLCPHWFGSGPGVSCANPTGGKRRELIVLIALAVLLPLSTIVSRHYACRGAKCSRERNRAHMLMHAISLIVLGFVVQGCYCPLGTFQYAFLPGGLAFLGWMGLAILLLPVVFSLFWGRVFCGWVCPMGALQDLLGRIHVPGKPRLPAALDKALHYLKYVVLVGLVAFLSAEASGVLSAGIWPAVFCAVDPFHTIFTGFLVGSLWLAGITILLAIFLGRFFCKYLCFYGALLSLLSRLRLWRLLTGPSRVAADAEDEMQTEEWEVEENQD